MNSNYHTFFLEKLQKSVTIWEHLPKRSDNLRSWTVCENQELGVNKCKLGKKITFINSLANILGKCVLDCKIVSWELINVNCVLYSIAHILH